MTPTFFLLNKITKSEKRKGNDMEEEKKEKIKQICELANGLNRREWILIEKEIEKKILSSKFKNRIKS